VDRASGYFYPVSDRLRLRVVDLRGRVGQRGAQRAQRAPQPALAFRKNVLGYKPSPVSLEPFSTVYLGT